MRKAAINFCKLLLYFKIVHIPRCHTAALSGACILEIYVKNDGPSLHIARRRHFKLVQSMINRGIAIVLHAFKKIQFTPEQGQDKSGGESWAIPLDA
jgi:hypothetical protein